MATVTVVAPTAAEGTPAPAAGADVKGAEEPTYDEMKAWLTRCSLLKPGGGMSENHVLQQYNALLLKQESIHPGWAS